MIYFHSKVNIIDNSGGNFGKCIRILNSKNEGLIGDLILLVIKKLKFKQARIKKKKIYLGLILRTKKPVIRFDNTYLKFFENSIILLNKDKEMLFSKFKGPIFKEMRKFQKYGKILSKAYSII